jgi:hypothetical protein
MPIFRLKGKVTATKARDGRAPRSRAASMSFEEALVALSSIFLEPVSTRAALVRRVPCGRPWQTSNADACFAFKSSFYSLSVTVLLSVDRLLRALITCQQYGVKPWELKELSGSEYALGTTTSGVTG